MTAMNIQLTESERRSSAWTCIEAKLKERLASLRIRNDGPLDSTETADLRGAIKEVKALIALGAEPPRL